MPNKTSIQVIGSGCPTCKKFHALVIEAVNELNLNLEVEYLNDIQKIIDLGKMQSPILVINGQATLVGFTSDLEKIKEKIKNNL